MTAGFFDGISGLRQVLLWVVGTRVSLEAWESSAAAILRSDLNEEVPRDGRSIWLAEIERHFTFVAARNLIHAVDVADVTLELSSELRVSLTQHRNLLEHWDENMPVFNVWPRDQLPRHKSGMDYAETHPDSTPYGHLRWNNKVGPVLGSGITGAQLHTLLDGIQARIVDLQPDLASYVPEPAESPWRGEGAGKGRWFPKQPN